MEMISCAVFFSADLICYYNFKKLFKNGICLNVLAFVIITSDRAGEKVYSTFLLHT